MSNREGFQKISINLPTDVLETLRTIATNESMTVTETLKRAILVLKFINESQYSNKVILLKDIETKEIERVVFW
jgi:hypothetical protein